MGRKNALCPNLQVHGTDMGHVNELTYLGDIISGDGKNTKNINSRIAKGHGKINDIMEILEKTSMGQDYFKIALLLRESMFLNSILTNCDVWVGLTKNEVEQLEDLDLILLRKIFQTPFSVPKEAIYLELGCQNLGTVIKSRRLTYLHYLIKQEDATMLHKFFWTQWNFPAKRNEWTDQVKKDLEEFQFSKDLETLKKISISQFKTQVKKKAKEVAFFSFLEKKENHSKLENIFYSGLRMQKYLQELNKIDAQMVFSYRTRMANFRENYPNTGGPSVCPLCSSHCDSQKWSYQCPKIKENVKIKGNYSNIFSDCITTETVQNLTQINKFRKEFLEEQMVKNQNDCLTTRPRCGCKPTDSHTCCRIQPNSNLNCNSDVIE